jgi:hypothetical protein
MDVKVMRGDVDGDVDGDSDGEGDASSLVLTASCLLRFFLDEEKDDDDDVIDDDDINGNEDGERILPPSITARATEQDRKDTHVALPDS